MELEHNAKLREDKKAVDPGAHYRYEYRGIKMDPARIVTIYGCKNLMAGTIVKKTLCAGNRGAKDELQDVRDIICAAQRWEEMILEDMDND